MNCGMNWFGGYLNYSWGTFSSVNFCFVDCPHFNWISQRVVVDLIIACIYSFHVEDIDGRRMNNFAQHVTYT